MVNVNRKYVKVGIAALAVTALVIGLSVGLTQRNRTDKNLAAARGSDVGDVGGTISASADYDDECSSYTGKSGKSGGSKSGKSGGSKSAKSGGSYYYGSSSSSSREDDDSSSSSSKSSKSGASSSASRDESGDRRLVVPGTEDYASGTGASSEGVRRKLRNDLLRGKFVFVFA